MINGDKRVSLHYQYGFCFLSVKQFSLVQDCQSSFPFFSLLCVIPLMSLLYSCLGEFCFLEILRGTPFNPAVLYPSFPRSVELNCSDIYLRNLFFLYHWDNAETPLDLLEEAVHECKLISTVHFVYLNLRLQQIIGLCKAGVSRLMHHYAASLVLGAFWDSSSALVTIFPCPVVAHPNDGLDEGD